MIHIFNKNDYYKLIFTGYIAHKNINISWNFYQHCLVNTNFKNILNQPCGMNHIENVWAMFGSKIMKLLQKPCPKRFATYFECSLVRYSAIEDFSCDNSKCKRVETKIWLNFLNHWIRIFVWKYDGEVSPWNQNRSFRGVSINGKLTAISVLNAMETILKKIKVNCTFLSW